ncbi:hypothetical protein PAN31117_05400 [Pandoraea anapnoica]|uniref:Mu-like prophage FluMu protein gp37 n=1 Tax=Pandoraea anapnoica TaxID=2508301 RepID=A0A5E5ARS7_9BURK|nr:DUF1834 family protein [Pandoraea anapnoica]VVE76459.1 hypothetical protein PAN31117_05400 [Pandoraea anapnoica]
MGETTRPVKPAYVPIIAAVELAIVDRLARGLGSMVKEVKTYGGEFDMDDFENVVRRFPAVWVTFAGVKRTDPVSTSRTKFKAEATFAVMVGARNIRSEESTRHGGVTKDEVGTNMLITCVRRLLNQQDMGLPIRELQPGAIKTLFNTSVKSDAKSVFAMEFHTAWVEDSLSIGGFPQGGADDPLGEVFEQYGGQIDPPSPEFRSLVMKYYLEPNDGKPSLEDVVILEDQS